MLLFNPIRLRDRLVEAGAMDYLQAETFASAISESDVVELATKSDVAEVRAGFSELRAEFSDQRAEFSELRAEFSDLRAEFSRLEAKFSQFEAKFSQLEAHFAKLEARLMRWMLGGAALGGLIGGVAAGLLK